ncbi:MAG: sel1 repeat family protein [Oxalobacter sp.]|nr:sel1 repeat family protein [Oxalobacter sp.]
MRSGRAEKWARKLIASDKSEGYLLLGALYDEGSGSRRDYAKAAEYYRKTDTGRSDIGGDYRLGMFYLEGKGVRADKEKALAHLEEAADNRDNHAAFQLGMMYYEGKGVPQDDKKALGYFDRATYKRSPGMFNFGPDLFGEAYLPGYEYPRGVGKLMGKDPNVRAEAYYMMGLMAERGSGMKKRPSYAMQCYENAAEEGHLLAKQRLAVLKAPEEE